tara:strand:- start:916 stop:1248 length:333 start_codon:yes stop_codon:yes gene_type:complete
MNKFNQASYGFFALNTLYLALVYLYLPAFTPDASMVGSFMLYLLLILVLSFYVWKGNRILTLALALIYILRSVVSLIALLRGGFFPVVPYILPLLLITFYMLGRAVWDWK